MSLIHLVRGSQSARGVGCHVLARAAGTNRALKQTWSADMLLDGDQKSNLIFHLQGACDPAERFPICQVVLATDSWLARRDSHLDLEKASAGGRHVIQARFTLDRLRHD